MRSRANLRIAVLQNELAELHVDTKLLNLSEENGA
jgi:G3E family GTPase